MGFFLPALLIFLQLLFQLQFFTFVFLILLILLIFVAFLSENNRVFVWTIISFSIGLFAFIYIGRIVLELPLSHQDLFILNRVLLVIPVLFMIYVISKFNHSVLPFSYRINWDGMPSLKKVFQISILVLVLVLCYSLWDSRSFLVENLSKALLFAFINSVLVESLWRGILFTRVQTLIGGKWAIIVTSLSCGIAYYLFGYSLNFCLIFFVIGLFLGAITWKTKSLTPAVLLNFLLTLNLIFMNVVPLIIK